MDGLEAVADAIMKFEGWFPGTKSYSHRNPGNLEDIHGNMRVFPNFVSGYGALISDLKAKFTGQSKTGLGPDSTLLQLMMHYAPPTDNNPTLTYTEFISNWCSKALGKEVTVRTQLKEIWTMAV